MGFSLSLKILFSLAREPHGMDYAKPLPSHVFLLMLMLIFFFFTRSPSLDYKKSLFLLLHLLAFCQPSSPTFSWHKMGRERNIIKRDRMCKLASSIFALIWKYLHFVLGVFGILWHASLSIERLGFTRHLDSRIFLSFFLFFISSTKYSEFHRSCL